MVQVIENDRGKYMLPKITKMAYKKEIEDFHEFLKSLLNNDDVMLRTTFFKLVTQRAWSKVSIITCLVQLVIDGVLEVHERGAIFEIVLLEREKRQKRNKITGLPLPPPKIKLIPTNIEKRLCRKIARHLENIVISYENLFTPKQMALYKGHMENSITISHALTGKEDMRVLHVLPLTDHIELRHYYIHKFLLAFPSLNATDELVKNFNFNLEKIKKEKKYGYTNPLGL